MKPTTNQFKIYFLWSNNALIGWDPTTTDIYLRNNYSDIKTVAEYMLQHINYKPKTIFRGIIMKEDNIKELLPHKNMKYLSFSEDIDIAESFANPNGFGAEFGLNYRLGNNGYIIIYQPDIKEIPFHHHFIDIFPYREFWDSIGITAREKTLEIQKEVTILQPDIPFKLIKKHYATQKIAQ